MSGDQLVPQLVESKRVPLEIIIRIFPVADAARPPPWLMTGVAGRQVRPPFVETHGTASSPLYWAAILLPSAEQTTDDQVLSSFVPTNQFAPKLVEIVR